LTRTTNARIAAFTYLFYTAIGICSDLLMHQAMGVEGDAAKLARIGQYATNVRLTILITLLECLSALVLAVTLYRIACVTKRHGCAGTADAIIESLSEQRASEFDL
jgi:uncharacterized protein DUF4386